MQINYQLFHNTLDNNNLTYMKNVKKYSYIPAFLKSPDYKMGVLEDVIVESSLLWLDLKATDLLYYIENKFTENQDETTLICLTEMAREFAREAIVHPIINDKSSAYEKRDAMELFGLIMHLGEVFTTWLLWISMDEAKEVRTAVETTDSETKTIRIEELDGNKAVWDKVLNTKKKDSAQAFLDWISEQLEEELEK